MKLFYFLFCLLNLVVPNQSFNLTSINDSQSRSSNNLKIQLLQNYNRDIIPLETNSLDITIGLVLNSIEEINQKDGTINLNIWLRYKWYDYQMIWDKNEWNISELTFTSNPESEFSLWIPDIYLYNSGEIPMKNLEYSRLSVKNNGYVFWSRPGNIRLTCDFDLNNFPFDTQECFIKFGSWSHNMEIMTLIKDNPDIELEYYQPNEEWELSNIYSQINIKNYSCCLTDFYDITYIFILKRNYQFYSVNIILPLFLTSMLIFVSLFIPYDSGERISFTITIMLSLIIYLLILSDHLPKTNNIPILSNIIVLLIILSLISICFTILITSFQFEKNNIKEKKSTTIEQKTLKKIYGLFYKTNSIENIEEINRTNSYIYANTDNTNLINKIDNIINKVELICNVSLIIYFISILGYYFSI